MSRKAFVIGVALGVAAFGALALIPATSPLRGDRHDVQLTSTDMSDEIAQANSAIDTLAREAIWGQRFAEFQQSLQDGWTSSIAGLEGEQAPLVDPGTGDLPSSVANADDTLAGVLTHLVGLEQGFPEIPVVDPGGDGLADLTQLPTLLGDELQILALDYTQFMPDAFADLGATLAATFFG